MNEYDKTSIQINRCKRILDRVDDYVDCPIQEYRTALRKALMEEFEAPATAPPAAAGSVDTPRLQQLMTRLNLSAGCDGIVQAKKELISHINAWAAQHVANAIKDQKERAEKAEAQLSIELERVQDYYTRWRCERENPTNTHRLDTWQAACGKARAERDKAEARVKELESRFLTTAHHPV